MRYASTTPWQNAIITITSDDDLSDVVTLGAEVDYLQILIPTIDSANVFLQVAETPSSTFYDLTDIYIASGTGSVANVVPIGGFAHIKIRTSNSQTANRTFRVRGLSEQIRRG